MIWEDANQDIKSEKELKFPAEEELSKLLQVQGQIIYKSRVRFLFQSLRTPELWSYQIWQLGVFECVALKSNNRAICDIHVVLSRRIWIICLNDQSTDWATISVHYLRNISDNKHIRNAAKFSKSSVWLLVLYLVSLWCPHVPHSCCSSLESTETWGVMK